MKVTSRCRYPRGLAARGSVGDPSLRRSGALALILTNGEKVRTISAYRTRPRVIMPTWHLSLPPPSSKARRTTRHIHLAKAYDLYRQLFATFEPYLAGIDRLIIGHLPSWRICLLLPSVTERPPHEIWRPSSSWRPAWLIKRFAVVMTNRRCDRGHAKEDLRSPVRAWQVSPTRSLLMLLTRPELRQRTSSSTGGPKPRRSDVWIAWPALRTGSSYPSKVPTARVFEGPQFTKEALSRAAKGRLRSAHFITHGVPRTRADPALSARDPTSKSFLLKQRGNYRRRRKYSRSIGGSSCVSSLPKVRWTRQGWGSWRSRGRLLCNGSDAVIATYWKIISPEVQTITPDLLASIDRRQAQKGLAQELRQRMLKLAFDPPAESPTSRPGFSSPFFLIGVTPAGRINEATRQRALRSNNPYTHLRGWTATAYGTER